MLCCLHETIAGRGDGAGKGGVVLLVLLLSSQLDMSNTSNMAALLDRLKLMGLNEQRLEPSVLEEFRHVASDVKKMESNARAEARERAVKGQDGMFLPPVLVGGGRKLETPPHLFNPKKSRPMDVDPQAQGEPRAVPSDPPADRPATQATSKSPGYVLAKLRTNPPLPPRRMVWEGGGGGELIYLSSLPLLGDPRGRLDA